MSEEEKKIIDRINKSYDYNTQYVEARAEDWNCIVDLIDKQQKEIEALKQEKEYLNCIIESDEDNYINKDKIRKKLKKLRREENKIYKLDYELEPEKAIDCLLLRIGDLEELLEEK